MVQERRGGRDMAEGLETLDAFGGAGWDLVCALMAFQPRKRLSASQALAHPFFSGARSTGLVAGVMARIAQAADAVRSQQLAHISTCYQLTQLHCMLMWSL